VAGGGGALAFLLGAFRRVAVRLGVGGSCWRGAGGSRSALRRLLTFCGGLVWFDGFLFFLFSIVLEFGGQAVDRWGKVFG